jgi:hypothetical protein
MSSIRRWSARPLAPWARAAGCVLLCLVCAGAAAAQRRSQRAAEDESEFGPIVRAYLGYLKNQQEVVDDRISRHEIDRAYYIRNSNRIRALRQTAIRIARQTQNDYLPELEAVTRDEFGLLFDLPPELHQLQEGELLGYQFRFVGVADAGRERFYVFARLDPYEQAELRKNEQETKRPPAKQPGAADAAPSAPDPDSETTTNNSRPRRVGNPPR